MFDFLYTVPEGVITKWASPENERAEKGNGGREKNGMKIVLINNSGKELPSLYYDVDYTMGDRHGDDSLYFHAQFNRENPTTMTRDFEILKKTTGKGRFLGSNIGVKADRAVNFDTWWGEGEVKIYMDGDTDFPSLCGTAPFGLFERSDDWSCCAYFYLDRPIH